DRLSHYLPALQEVFGGEDRTAAVMIGALVENYLERLLRFRLVAEDTFLNRLFDYPGALATFAAKIDMCLATGAFGKTTYDNLRIVKDIRNAFAHQLQMPDTKAQWDKVSFATPLVEAWCNS